jgi:hypothetical protein
MTTSEVEEQPAAAAAQPRERWWWAHLLGILLVAVLITVLHSQAFTRLSLLDETQHGDSLYRAARGEIVRAGDLIGPEIIAEFEIRGGYFGSELEPFENSAYAHPPTYYFLTAAPARLIRFLTPVESLLTAGRLVGALWSWAALVVLWDACRRRGAGVVARWGVVLLLAATPATLHFTATVNTDAAAAFTGALVVWAVLRWDEGWDGRVGLAVLAGVGVFVGMVKFTHLMAVGAGALFLLLRSAPVRAAGVAAGTGLRSIARRIDRRRVLAATTLLGAGLLASAFWLAVAAGTAQVDPSTFAINEQYEVDTFDWRTAAANLRAMASPFGDGHIPHELGLLKELPLRRLLDWLVLGAVFGAAIMAAAPWQRSLAQGFSFAMVVGGPLFVVILYVTQGLYFAVPPRYGLALAPGLLLLVAVASRTRAYTWGLLAFGAVTYGATLYVLLNPVPPA